MKKPTFKNKPNLCYNIGEKQLWESRSCAITAFIFAIINEELYVLGEKRSDTMIDAPGKWVAPGGYMDWGEDGWDCLRREVYEETSMYIDNYKNNLIFDNNKEPFYVKTQPNENRQNIVLNYCLVFDFCNKQELFHKIEEHMDKEVSLIKWISVNDISKYDWAFDHDIRIKMALSKVIDGIDNLMNFVIAKY